MEWQGVIHTEICDNSGIESPMHYNNVNIYPNPTTGIINFEGENIEAIEILNSIGEVVCIAENENIDLSDQPNGIFFVKIQTNKCIITRKITKQ